MKVSHKVRATFLFPYLYLFFNYNHIFSFTFTSFVPTKKHGKGEKFLKMEKLKKGKVCRTVIKDKQKVTEAPTYRFYSHRYSLLSTITSDQDAPLTHVLTKNLKNISCVILLRV